MYQAHVAGKLRLVGALAALEQLGVPHAAAGGLAAFPAALRFVQAMSAAGLRLAVASSSKNADQMMKLVALDSGQRLFDVFDAYACGLRDLPRGKPDPAIFLVAAGELAHDAGLLRGQAADLVVTSRTRSMWTSWQPAICVFTLS